MNRDELMDFLRANLRIKVETESRYTGGMDGGPAYEDCHTIQLLLDGEVISEEALG